MALQGSGETVLVVEDDPLVRAVLASLLHDLDYRVIEAENADVGLAALRSGIVADLILTDLAMPGSMDGLQFATLTRTRYPDIPVLLSTGHLDPFRRADAARRRVPPKAHLQPDRGRAARRLA